MQEIKGEGKKGGEGRKRKFRVFPIVPSFRSSTFPIRPSKGEGEKGGKKGKKGKKSCSGQNCQSNKRLRVPVSLSADRLKKERGGRGGEGGGGKACCVSRRLASCQSCPPRKGERHSRRIARVFPTRLSVGMKERKERKGRTPSLPPHSKGPALRGGESKGEENSILPALPPQ